MHSAYDEWAKRRIVSAHGPAKITILSTSRCNLECFMCWHGLAGEMPETMTPETLDPFFKRAGSVLYSGGEPLWFTEKVNKSGAQIHHHLISRYPHIKLSALTNGVFLSGEKAEAVLKNFDALCVSLDTLDPGVYETICGKPVLETVLANLENIFEMKKREGLGRSDPPVISINSIVMESTIDALPAVAEKVWELGALQHSVSLLKDLLDPDYGHYGIAGYISDKNSPDASQRISESHSVRMKRELIRKPSIQKERLNKVKTELQKVYDKTGLELLDKSRLFSTWEVPHPSRVESVCSYPWTNALIHQNGNVFCCCDNSTVMGNIGKQTFEEIWNGEVARDMRASFVSGEMKGCIRNSCEALIDHFSVLDTFKKPVAENLGALFERPDSVESIFLLRSAPLFQSYLAVEALTRKFPNAVIDMVTNRDGVVEGVHWDEAVNAMVYSGETFEPNEFAEWPRSKNGNGGYSLAVMIYNNAKRDGYEKAEQVIRSISAKNRVGIMPDGSTVRL